ncbi:MAG: CDP-alcohol phosphatidyltransferase family protein [Gammaproteobacteria bacterium]|nr:CDP-alcohol phosphatidyltransferase family protein [Gammaproteobacteria bacterium]
MVSIYQLKPRFQSLLRPVARYCAGAGITANSVTLTAMLISLALGAMLGAAGGQRALFFLLPLWMFLRMAFNAIDGMLAREFGQKSALGAYLNELSDVISDAALYLPFVTITPFGWSSVGAVVFFSLNAMLQERGHESVGAGHAIAVQNFFENLSMLLMVGFYVLMNKAGVSVVATATGFGALVLTGIALLAWWRVSKANATARLIEEANR